MKKIVRHRIFIGLSVIFLIPTVLIMLIAILLYLPPIQRFAVEKSCEIASANSDFKISLSSFHLSFPLRIKLSNIVVAQENDTILKSEQLNINVSMLPLLKKKIEINYILLSKTWLDTRGLIDGVKINGDIGYLRTSSRSVDLESQTIDITQFHLNDANVKLLLSDKSNEEEDTVKNENNWKIRVRKSNINNLNFYLSIPGDTLMLNCGFANSKLNNIVINLDNESYESKTIKIDNGFCNIDLEKPSETPSPLKHFQLNELNFVAQDFIYAPGKINADVRRLTFNQPEGITIDKGSANVNSDSTNITLSDLILKSKNGSNIFLKAQLPWKMLEGEKGGNSFAELKLHLNKLDLKGFLTEPEFNAMKNMPDSLITISSKVNGNLNKLKLDTIDIQINKLAHFGANGIATKVYDTKKISTIFNWNIDISDIHKLLYLRDSPDSIGFQPVNLSGSAIFETGEIKTRLNISTNQGKITGGALYNIAKARYKTKLNIENLNLAKILPEIPLNNLTLKLLLEGEGWDFIKPETNYRLTAEIDSLAYENYFIDNITLDAKQNNLLSHVDIKSGDSLSNSFVRIMANTKLTEPIIYSKLNFIVNNFNFQKAGITSDPLTISFNIKCDGHSDFNNLYSLNLTGKDFKLATPIRTYTPDSLDLVFHTSPDTGYVDLHTGDLMVKGSLNGGYDMLISNINNTISQWQLSKRNKDIKFNIKEYKKHLPDLSINIKSGNKNMAANFLAMQNIFYNKFYFICNVDSAKGIDVKSGLYNLKKDNAYIDSLKLSLIEDASGITYYSNMRSTSVNPNEEKATFAAALFGTLVENELKTTFVFRDKKNSIGAQLGLSTFILPNGINLHFNPNAILLGHKFKFNDNNYLFIGDNLVINGNIELKDSINSGGRFYTTADSSLLRNLSLELFNINLKSTTQLIPFAPNLGGMLNMDVHYTEGGQGASLSSDIHANGLSYNNILLGDESLEFVYLPKDNNSHYIDLLLRHNDRKIVEIIGDYNNDSIESQIGAKMQIHNFPVKLSNAFLAETGVSLDGYIDGEVVLNGKSDAPKMDGFILFDSVEVDAPMFGTQFNLKNDSVKIINNNLYFNNFDIYTKGDSPFKIDGTIDISHLLNPLLNIRMRANNYELVNAQRSKQSILYGKMWVNLNSRLTGTINSLKMRGSATLLSKSDITYVLSNTPLTTQNDLDGLVTFVNFKDTTQVVKAEKDYRLGNINLDLKLTIEDGAKINADFDENRTSYIELQGGGNLNLTYSGETGLALTGRYELSSGLMKYALPIIPLKTFTISRGSYINWTGDIMNPTLNITALERVMSSVSIDNVSQTVTFNVGVILTNKLDNIGLKFTLSAPDNAVVQNELNTVDNETLNKYAVTMLITGAYLGNNGNLSVSSALSSFIDAKVNDIAGAAMKSVNINVGISDVEDSETGDSYKNYSFSFAKRFWNDRLTVVIGGEVNSGQQNNTNESFINNVSLEWKISKTGNRYIRVFYDKNYESILEGEITETGVGYVYKRRFAKFNELLIFRKKKNNTPTNTGVYQRERREERK